MCKLSTFKHKRIVVTGHTGFKGSWLCLWLSYLGANVTGVSNNVPSEPSHFEVSQLKSYVDDLRIDICDKESLKSLFQEIKPDYVFHLAAQALVKKAYKNPIETFATNTMGTINVLEALRGLRNPCVAILVTSDKCYENVEWEWGYRETDTLGGADPYSASKGAAELAISSYLSSFMPQDGLIRIGIGRAGNVIGGGDWAEDRLVPDCMRAWSNRKLVELRNPLSTRPWQHVLEPLSGYITLAMELRDRQELHGEAFNFGPPVTHNHSVGELVSEIACHWENVRWDDVSSKYGGPYESGLLKLNCDKALHHLNWRAVWDFERTVQETVVWYRSYYGQKSKSMFNLSLEQIKEYIMTANNEGISWAM